MLQTKHYCLFLITLAMIAGCKSSSSSSGSTEGITDPNSNVSQSVMSAASNAAASSEGGSVGFAYDDNYLDPSDAISAFSSACTMGTARGSCSASSDTITWNNCTVDSGRGTMSGSWNESFTTTAGGAAAGACTIPVANGKTVTRTTTGSVLTLTSGATVTTDTNGGTAWDGTTIPGTGDSTSNSAGTRTIVIHGTHRVKKGPRGTTWFDHYLTSTGLTVTGTRATNNRVISGSMTLYHNRLRYTATNTFNSVTYGDSTCCYPTSGSISSTVTGSVSGTMNLAFSSTCGSATFTDTTGSSSSLTLDQCN